MFNLKLVLLELFIFTSRNGRIRNWKTFVEEEKRSFEILFDLREGLEGRPSKQAILALRVVHRLVRYYDEMHAAITVKYRCPLYQLKERTSVLMERLDKNDGALDSY